MTTVLTDLVRLTLPVIALGLSKDVPDYTQYRSAVIGRLNGCLTSIDTRSLYWCLSNAEKLPPPWPRLAIIEAE